MHQLRMKSKRIYKYYSFNNDYSLNMLRDNEFYFAQPSDLNDPFELMYSPIIENSEIARQFSKIDNEFWHNLTSMFVPCISKEDSMKIKLQFSQEKVDLTNLRTKLSDRSSTVLRKECRVFSTSTFKDSILLWSNYSHSHQGFCIEIDICKLIGSIARFYRDTNCFFAHGLVEYNDSYPYLDFAFHPKFGLIPKNPHDGLIALFKKPTAWSYEHEYRLVIAVNNNPKPDQDNCIKHFCDDKEVVTAIYLGCNCDLKNQYVNELIHLSDARNIPVYQAELSMNSYQLLFHSLDIQKHY